MVTRRMGKEKGEKGKGRRRNEGTDQSRMMDSGKKGQTDAGELLPKGMTDCYNRMFNLQLG